MTKLILLTLWALVILSLIPVAMAESLPSALGWIVISLGLLLASLVCDARLRPARRKQTPPKSLCGACREVLRGALSACARCLTPRHTSCAARPCRSPTCGSVA